VSLQPTSDLILMADDDPNDRTLITRALQAAGLECKIRQVHDGEEAINYFKGADGFSDRTQCPLPQLLLCDIKMPKVTGFEVLQWIRSQRAFHKLPVIIMSSSDLPNDMARAYQLGANEFLTKARILKNAADVGALLQKFVSCKPPVLSH
jgi:CheY-like chemotaxis protein